MVSSTIRQFAMTASLRLLHLSLRSHPFLEKEPPDTEDGSAMILRNVGNCSPKTTASYPRKLKQLLLHPFRAIYFQIIVPSLASWSSSVSFTASWRHSSTVAYRGGWFGGFKPPPPKFRRYRWSPRSHEQEPASRFPFVVHCVLIRL